MAVRPSCPRARRASAAQGGRHLRRSGHLHEDWRLSRQEGRRPGRVRSAAELVEGSRSPSRVFLRMEQVYRRSCRRSRCRRHRELLRGDVYDGQEQEREVREHRRLLRATARIASAAWLGVRLRSASLHLLGTGGALRLRLSPSVRSVRRNSSAPGFRKFCWRSLMEAGCWSRERSLQEGRERGHELGRHPAPLLWVHLGEARRGASSISRRRRPAGCLAERRHVLRGHHPRGDLPGRMESGSWEAAAAVFTKRCFSTCEETGTGSKGTPPDCVGRLGTRGKSRIDGGEDPLVSEEGLGNQSAGQRRADGCAPSAGPGVAADRSWACLRRLWSSERPAWLPEPGPWKSCAARGRAVPGDRRGGARSRLGRHRTRGGGLVPVSAASPKLRCAFAIMARTFTSTSPRAASRPREPRVRWRRRR